MRIAQSASLIAAFSLALILGRTVATELACAAAPHPGDTVLNADQTVLLMWDPVSKIEHFIRRASFTSNDRDFGFLIPSPTQPELEESGDEVFDNLKQITKPEYLRRTEWQFGSLLLSTISDTRGIAPTSVMKSADFVHVLDEKVVAGFNAVVLEASSAGALAKWLGAHEYAVSPEIEKWSKPYVDAGWKITALKIAKATAGGDGPATVTAGALRMSFKTDRPLFPYREPEYPADATKNVRERLLRIYFLGDARYDGTLTQESPWTGKAVWSKPLDDSQRKRILDALKLPVTSGAAKGWLTEFEDKWPYKVAPADLYFTHENTQEELKRPPIYYTNYATIPIEPLVVLIVAVLAGVFYFRRRLRAAS